MTLRPGELVTLRRQGRTGLWVALVVRVEVDRCTVRYVDHVEQDVGAPEVARSADLLAPEHVHHAAMLWAFWFQYRGFLHGHAAARWSPR
jgi:hypothetical protein